MRNRSSIVLSTIAVVLFACTDDTPSDAFAPEPCRAQPVFDQVVLNTLTEQDIRVAALDAAERLVPVLAGGKRASDLEAALRTVSAGQERDAVCRAIRSVRDLREAQPGASENEPGRVAIGLVLDLVETYYARTS